MSQPRYFTSFRLVRFVSLCVVSSLAILVALLGCTNTTSNPLVTNINNATLNHTNDPLAIGTKPTAPAKQKIPSFIHNTESPLQPLTGNDMDFVAILNQGAGAITIWTSKQASWVWVHSIALHKQFGDAFNWAIQPIGDGFVRFVNKLTRTCLNAYGQGVIHYPCDPNNPNQSFLLLPMNNGAVAIQSVSTHLCLQTSMRNKTNHPLVLNKCLQIANSEQQWSITPPLLKPKPIKYP